MARKIEVACTKCNGTGWFHEGKELGCFYCKGGRKLKGTGVDRDSAVILVTDEVFNKWIPRNEAVKAVCIYTGWTTSKAKNFLNYRMHKTHHALTFDKDMVIAKKYYTGPYVEEAAVTDECPEHEAPYEDVPEDVIHDMLEFQKETGVDLGYQDMQQ